MDRPILSLTRMVHRIERRAPLGQADRDALLALPYHVRSLGPGAHIVRDGDRPEYCGLLLAGFWATLLSFTAQSQEA